MPRILLLAFATMAGMLGIEPGPAAARPTRQTVAPADDRQVATFFDAFVRERMKALDIPGGAVVVVRDGRIILNRGYGHADVRSKRRVDVDRTVFRAASISKVVPWLLAMQLVEEDRLDLDADVNGYLDFTVPAAFDAPITMRHLMTHTAGFPERFHGVFDQDLSQSLGERLRRNIPQRIYAPGTTVAYSNYGAALAGYIVERLRGEPWYALAARRFLRPLGMTGSTVLQPVPAALRPLLASTYEFGSDDPGPFRVTPLAPMGSLSPTVTDMGRLLLMLSDRGKVRGRPFVQPRTLDAMFTLQKPLLPGLPDGMGLGFLVGRYHGVRYAGHGGNMSTLATDIEVLPDAGLAWYYVFNSQGEGEGGRHVRDALLRQAIDRFVAVGVRPPEAIGPSSASDVAGSYTSSRRIFFGPLMATGLLDTTIVRAGRGGTLTIESAGRLTEWLPSGRDRFEERNSGVPLTVTRDGRGRVVRLASAALYPAAVFERAPLLVEVVPVVAVFSLATILASLLARPVAALVGRRRTARRIARGEPAQARTKAASAIWAARGYWLIVLSLLGWAVFALSLAIDFAMLFRTPVLVRSALGVLTLSTGPAAGAMLWDAARNRTRAWPPRVWALIVALAAAGLAWLYYTLDVINFSADW